MRYPAARTDRQDPMADLSVSHRHPLRFGFFLVPNADDPLLATATRVEDLGLDYIGIQDHPYQRRYVDTFALVPFIAARTSTVRLFTDVANLPLRHPPVLAKTAVTISRLSGGRFDLGLGAGAFWDAIAAYGGARRSPRESLEALKEAVSVIRAIWSGERGIRIEGRHYHLTGAHGGPVPEEPIGLWIGAYAPKGLAFTGAVADGWTPSFRGDFAALRNMSARIDDAARAAGRDPADIRRILNVGGTITGGPSRGPLQGPVDQWVAELAGAAAMGFDTFVFANDEGGQLDRFAQEVVPALRERIR